MQFYKTTGLNPPQSEESKNRLMLGSRLREIFQVSNDGSSQNFKESISASNKNGGFTKQDETNLNF